jgi:hypothetical protein
MGRRILGISVTARVTEEPVVIPKISLLDGGDGAMGDREKRRGPIYAAVWLLLFPTIVLSVIAFGGMNLGLSSVGLFILVALWLVPAILLARK